MHTHRTFGGITIAALVAVVFFGAAVPAYAAYVIEATESEVFGDFMVGPAKVEETLAPGTSVTAEIMVTNRTGERRRFTLEIEDAQGAENPEAGIELLGDDRGPYSLKDYLQIGDTTFELGHGERARIPVVITIPADATPGGRYGSVLVSNTSLTPAQGSGAVVRSRIGTLFFVTVPGDVVKSGSLEKFSTAPEGKTFFFGNEVPLQMLFKNSGAVHLTPFGAVTVRNIFGGEVASIEVDPWYAMPDVSRRREVLFAGAHLFGIYTAEAVIDRSYGNVVDTKRVSFVALSWSGALMFLGVLALLTIASGAAWKYGRRKFGN